jgi:hypothetical protein
MKDVLGFVAFWELDTKSDRAYFKFIALFIVAPSANFKVQSLSGGNALTISAM